MRRSSPTTLYIKTWKRTEDIPLPIDTNTNPHIWAQFCFNELKIAYTMLNCIQSFESFLNINTSSKKLAWEKNQTWESHWISISNSLHKFQMWKQLPPSFLGIELYQRNTNDYKQSKAIFWPLQKPTSCPKYSHVLRTGTPPVGFLGEAFLFVDRH